jgi:hypothetical protein
LLSTGQEFSGVIQCNLHAAEHHGRERVKDVLNSAAALVPIWSVSDRSCALINKSYIEMLVLDEMDLAEPGDPDMTLHRDVALTLARGTELRGTMLVSTPPERSRTLDFLNRGERFFYLQTTEGERLINLEHVVIARDFAAHAPAEV